MARKTERIIATGATDSPFSLAVVTARAALRAISSQDNCPAEACRP